MRYSLKFKYLLLLAAIALCSLSSPAQREKNYIYLFDCTGSMRTNGLWETAQDALDKNITLRTGIPGSRFTVIPFGDHPYETLSFDNTEYGKRKPNISKALDKYIAEAKYTRISDVLKEGFKNVDFNKDNEIYLFTDGMPNGGDSSEKVAATINEWCANHRNSKLFYVALTKGVINPVIKQAIDACADASIVQCEDGLIPVITDLSTDIFTTLEELRTPIKLSFSVPADYEVRASASDPLFEISIVGNQAKDGESQVRISPKSGLSPDQLHQTLQGGEYVFTATIQSADSRFAIANPMVNVHILDQIPSRLRIADGEDELRAEGVDWYDSFLWSKAKADEKTVWDLTPVFKNQLQSSALTLKFNPTDNQSRDFQAWYNGEPLEKDAVIRIVPGAPAILEVLFNHDATTGKRYFTLSPTATEGLDIINDRPENLYEGTSLRTDYHVVWNPLKTLLFWLGIGLLALLIIWFFILKRLLFPTIKMGKVTLVGPGSYYATKKIKGARKVILTSRRKS